MRYPRIKLPLLLAAAVVICVVGATGALASWTVNRTTFTVTVRAGTLGTGPKPAVSVAGSDVTVAWTPAPPASFRVWRYANGSKGALVACALPLSQATCVDKAVEHGKKWTYTVQPVLGNSWVGREGPPSEPVQITGPQVAVTPTPSTTGGPAATTGAPPAAPKLAATTGPTAQPPATTQAPPAATTPPAAGPTPATATTPSGEATATA
ncbi:hypothetical protein [Dactylosporangium matsuzakiense]|uniref:hypothetical protein n=1 Tax=Dactylosporangium matsuzakiense TaxID=53360 RepID=UPI0021C261E4|nr:hypothetical protein [Dactylosporangium matsuzakiense]UWZ44855.1 hypothetical protein Dmats_47390 [Dactylosporangium matsuzakiense]